MQNLSYKFNIKKQKISNSNTPKQNRRNSTNINGFGRKNALQNEERMIK